MDARRRVAVVGCGYWGKNLVRNFAELGRSTAMVDENRPSATRSSLSTAGAALRSMKC